jgi:ketosteroid isomerase-like protein
MGEAREVMDRVTQAVIDHDLDAAAACYAEDAVAVTPDQGEIRGRDAIRGYFKGQVDGFPDGGYEYIQKHDAGNVAIDEGYLTGTHTGALAMPTGESFAPTGKQIRVRGCDIASVQGGLITAHRFYFDQMEFLGQLGMLPDVPS